MLKDILQTLMAFALLAIGVGFFIVLLAPFFW